MVASRGSHNGHEGHYFGGRGEHGFGEHDSFVGRASDRRTSLSASHFGFSLSYVSYDFSQYSSSQPRCHQNFGQCVLGPSSSGPHNSSFRSNSYAHELLQCYNCCSYGYVAVVCPSKATSMPASPTCLQGMTAHQ